MPTASAPTLNATHVRCPGCGAPAGEPSLTSCAYCRASLGKRACPRCHCRMAPGVTYCPFCGTGTVTPTIELTIMRCPCGDGDLVQRILPVRSGDTGDDLYLAECAACHGVWVTRESIDRMVASHADDTLLLALAPGIAPTRASRAVGVGDTNVRYRPCPECQRMMNRVNYARISGIIVDVCRDHGTWFDVHELPALLEFVKRGGLDRARAKETEALSDERRRLERERLMRSSMEQGRQSLGDRSSAREWKHESAFTLIRDLFLRV
jgi:Zn-finger nucleic acid-binding protein